MRKIVLISLLAAASVLVASQQTWHLSPEQKWVEVSEETDAPLFNITEAKKLVAIGKTTQAKKKFAQIRDSYPDLAGDDYDSFVKAELLYSKRKYEAASKRYDIFMDTYPDSQLHEAAMERQFSIATAFLTGHKTTVLGIFKSKAYEEGSEIMHSLADRAGDAPKAQKAMTSLAKYTEKRGAYEEAYQVWLEISDSWPTGKIGRESLASMARTLKKAYKGPAYDSTVLESSKSYYSRFQERYPDYADKIEAQKNISEIETSLSEKHLAIAKYYDRTDSFVAANLYYQNVINDWPGSQAAEAAQQGLTALAERQQKPVKKRLWL
ncbi:MAG: outer membrane protein assembly factor BamD [Anaerohalosphaeraceae bacterium]|nr:outer membrane protein assembly factor BamD [Anaerohalosphaeraceae bacterium]